MPRHFAEPELIVASHNAGKVREISDLLAPYDIAIRSAASLGLPEPEETGASFVENAELKALAAVQASQKPALADDSGLVVPALGGQPGIYSARWGGPDRDFGLAMERVNAELGEGDRKAHFVAVLSLAWADGHVESFEGKVYGRLVWPPRGDKGFGYDPMFQACGQTITFGEMEPALKHGMSHRAEAFKQLIHACFGRRS